MTLEADIAALSTQLTGLTTVVRGWLADSDARIAAGLAQLPSNAELNSRIIAAFAADLTQNADDLLFSKARGVESWQAANPLAADAADNTRTVWGKLLIGTASSNEALLIPREGVMDGAAFVVTVTDADFSAPGATQNPLYNLDWSHSQLQLVFAPSTMDSDAINTYLGTVTHAPPSVGSAALPAGGTSALQRLVGLCLVPSANTDAQLALFVRWINQLAPDYPGANNVQAVQNFGGNGQFRINPMMVHPNLAA